MRGETPREIEFKLDVGPAETDEVRSELFAALGPGRGPERLVSVYFDTRGHDLKAHGLTLRIRSRGGQRVQTIKAGAGARAGLFDRAEWETPAGDVPDLGAAAGTAVASLVPQGEPLLPLFEVVVERTIWMVESGTSLMELAFDVGRVAATGLSQPFTEIEFELKRGRAADLFALIRRFDSLSRLAIGVVAKSDRGYALVEGRQRAAAKPDAVTLDPSMTAAMAFQAIAHACVRHFRQNELLLVEERAPEALHQARVAMRRLRAALTLFKDRIADERIGDIKDRLKAVSRQLGDARDLDVYLKTRAQPGNSGDAEAAAVIAAVKERQARAYDTVIATLRSAAFRRLLIDLVEWLETGPWLDGRPPAQAGGDQPFDAFAAAALDRRRRKVKRRGRHLRRLTPHERHRVRIAVKTLRYAADFFGDLARGSKRRHRRAAFIDALEAMQNNLGELNDIRTARDLEATLWRPSGHDAATPDAEAADRRVERLLRTSAAAHHDFAAIKRFWRNTPRRA